MGSSSCILVFSPPTKFPFCHSWLTLLQRSEVSIDCCKLGEGNSTFLQQAAYITGGTYVQPTRQAALLQYLLVSPKIKAAACAGYGRLWPLACIVVMGVFNEIYTIESVQGDASATRSDVAACAAWQVLNEGREVWPEALTL